jgi:hypothetical protein
VRGSMSIGSRWESLSCEKDTCLFTSTQFSYELISLTYTAITADLSG